MYIDSEVSTFNHMIENEVSSLKQVTCVEKQLRLFGHNTKKWHVKKYRPTTSNVKILKKKKRNYQAWSQQE